MQRDYLQLEHLSVGYNRRAVVEDISLSVKKGEIVALIGPNGAGKSTLLKSLSRNLEPVGGSVWLDGRELRQYTYKELSEKMAVILTDRIKAELMTCRDIVATGRYPYTGRLGILTKEDEEIVGGALHAVQAEDIAERDFQNISDGQRQRILLARAICQEPEIILLDEPTSYLDVKHKLELLSLLTRMAREKNITVLMSLHEIDLAEKTADRIVTVKGREKVGFGRPREIFKEEKIRDLYEIDNGFFDPLFGNIELQKPSGAVPEVFVIAGGGRGIPIYRQLQQKNVPFATGILYENDLDYRLARLLAVQTVTEKPFYPLSEETLLRAKNVMDTCRRVINAGCDLGSANTRMAELVQYAKEKGKLSENDGKSMAGGNR